MGTAVQSPSPPSKQTLSRHSFALFVIQGSHLNSGQRHEIANNPSRVETIKRTLNQTLAVILSLNNKVRRDRGVNISDFSFVRC